MPPTVSVIIPTINEEVCVGSAIHSAWEAGANEVIVADGGSRDRTVQIANDRHAVVTSCSAGRASQQNAGAALAHGEFLLFQHADCRLAPACLQQLKALVKQRPNVAHGGFKQSIAASGTLFRWIECGNAIRARWAGLTYGDQGIFVRRDLFQQIGGFPDAAIMEDVMLMRRLKRWGRPELLTGPLCVDPRRWKQRGILRQTAQNWIMLSAFLCGVSPNRLGRFYPRHDH